MTSIYLTTAKGNNNFVAKALCNGSATPTGSIKIIQMVNQQSVACAPIAGCAFATACSSAYTPSAITSTLAATCP